MKRLLVTILFSIVLMFDPYLLDAVAGDKNFTPVVPEAKKGTVYVFDQSRKKNKATDAYRCKYGETGNMSAIANMASAAGTE